MIKIKIIDEIIKDPKDELYDLQQKYNVKISRSNSSDAVYIFRNRNSFQIRVGHPISKEAKHLRNFKNVPVKRVTKNEVEKAILNYFGATPLLPKR